MTTLTLSCDSEVRCVYRTQKLLATNRTDEKASRWKEPLWILSTVSTLFVLCGFAKMPYGYYMLLRAAVCLTAVYRFSKALDLESRFWLWVYGSIAVLSNTIFPVRLGNKGIWEIINIVTIVFFWIGAAKLNSIAGEKQVARKKVNSGLSWKSLASQALLPSFGTVPPKNAAEQNPENSEKIKWLRPNSSHRK